MSGLDIATSIFRLLNVVSVISKADGIYKFNRPLNSRKKDVVISIPEYNSGQFNTGYVDVNIHVPNLELPNDQTSPDLVSMKSIVDAITPLISSIPGYSLSSRIIGIPVRDSDGQWYCNIRIGFIGIDDNAGKDIKLVLLSAVGDGYGGYTASRTDFWTGKGAVLELSKGNQLNINAGRHEFNMKVDWLLPFDATPEKYMVLLTDEGEYTIRGIVREGGLFRVSSVRNDGKINL